MTKTIFFTWFTKHCKSNDHHVSYVPTATRTILPKHLILSSDLKNETSLDIYIFLCVIMLLVQLASTYHKTLKNKLRKIKDYNCAGLSLSKQFRIFELRKVNANIIRFQEYQRNNHSKLKQWNRAICLDSKYSAFIITAKIFTVKSGKIFQTNGK